MPIMQIISLILVFWVMVPVAVYTLEILFSLLPQRKYPVKNQGMPSFVVLIPAHNESGTIQKTLANIIPQLSEHESILVVADNCTDDTAMVAAGYGVKVIERTHATERGKGYALDFGISYLKKAAPEVVIIVDADCMVEDGTLQKLAVAAVSKNSPAQALYLMKYKKPQLKQRIKEFAWTVKNLVRPLGLYNAGLPCQLMGTGMAFPWPILAETSLATGHIVEDMKLGIDMAVAGHAPVFLPSACVTSLFPDSAAAEHSQKKRWEHGHLNMIFSAFPGMFRTAILKRSKILLSMSLDLLIPPLALLAIGTILLVAVTFILSGIYVTNTAFILSSVTFLMMGVSTFIAWLKWGRDILSFTDLFLIPFYILGKVPLYISALFNRQKKWVRTDRD